VADKTKPTETVEEKLVELEKLHGELVRINVRGHGYVAFRAPTSGEYQKMFDHLSDPKRSNASTQRALVVACRVYPDTGDFKAILEAKPALARVACDALDDLAGGDLEVEAKK